MNGTAHSIRSISSSVLLLLAISAHAATVWYGPTISFTKSNYANPLLAENQDRLTTNVWITRGSSQGLFNANTESRFTHFLSPAGTEWANGSLENYETLSYTNWNHWAKGVNPNPYGTVGVHAVLHLIAEDIYLSVQFTSWTGGAPGGGPSYGGGFSYLRSTPVPEPTNAVPIVTWQQPANNAAFPPGFAISLRARATDSDGSVSNVDFFATPTNGPTINLGQGTLASDGYYVRAWTNPPPGQYQLHAEAVDNASGRGISDSVQIVVVDTSQPPTNAQTRTWTGADPSGYWSAPANWSPAGVLVNGDTLVFPGGLPPGDMVSTNDLTGSFFRSITFSGASRHTIRGNPITLTNRSDCIINSGTNVIACDLTFSGTPATPQYFVKSIHGYDELTLGNVGGGSLSVYFGMRLVITGQFTGGTLRVWGGTLALYGDDPSAGSAEVQNSSTLLVQGSRPNLNITMFWEFESAACPFLRGDGVVGDVLGCGHIILDSTLSVKSLGGRGASQYGWRVLDIHLNGTNVGEYGKLISSGDVTLTGGSLSASPGFNPQPGQVFTIVDKTSPGPMTTLPGYNTAIFGPEGTITTLNGMPFRISYVGGDGNDVTLTVVNNSSGFSNVTASVAPGLPGVAGGSVAWGDYDNDGRLDFLFTGYVGYGTGGSSYVSQLWRNTGTGFSNVTASVAPGLPRVGGSVAWADYDNDGRLDFLFTGSRISQLWRNTGAGFSNVTSNVAPGLPGLFSSSVAWGDYDNDGRLDFLLTGTTNFFPDESPIIFQSQVWRNTGAGFSNVTASVAPGLPGLSWGSVAWGDYDNDGWLDFLLTGGGGSQLWRNTGSGFSNVTASVAPGLPGGTGSSAAWGDYDNDGRLDFLLTGYFGSPASQLWRNTGSGFSNVTASVAPGLPGVYNGSTAWGDYDNDGRLDFLLTGGVDGLSGISQVWRNTGGGFSNVTASVAPGLPGNVSGGSVAWGDYDNDGRLDFLLTASGQLWRNNMPVASNAPPAAPTGLSSTLSGATVSLNWNPPADDLTPATGLTYNLRIGTTPGASDVLAPMALTDGLRLLPALGNAQAGTNAFVFNVAPGRDYYWSVQAVDTSFAGSPFAAEQQFTVAAPRIIELLMLGNGHFQFSFSNEASVIYAVLGTTNVALPLAQWTVLGPPVPLGGSLYRFTDTGAMGQAQRFYILREQ